MSAILRPGKFLSNNYLAFSVPIRTFIITRDRVRNAVRTARRNKARTRTEERRAREAVAMAEKQRSKNVVETEEVGEGGEGEGEGEEGKVTWKDWARERYERTKRRKIIRENREVQQRLLIEEQERVAMELGWEEGGGTGEDEGGEEREIEDGEERKDGEKKDSESFFSKFVAGYLKSSKGGKDKEEEGEDRKVLGLVVSDWASSQLSGILQQGEMGDIVIGDAAVGGGYGPI